MACAVKSLLSTPWRSLLTWERNSASTATFGVGTVFDAALQLESLALATQLRVDGLNVSVYPEPAKLPKQFKYADKLGMRFALVMGPDEAAAGNVTVKDLKSGTQQVVKRSDVASAIQKMLAE